MPFEGLARSISQEHEQAARTRSASASSRHTPFSPAIPTISRQDRIAESSSTHSTATLAEELDLEARGGLKDKSEKGQQGLTVEELDPFLVTMQGREHLSPHTWGVNYRWFLTAFSGLLVLNASEPFSSPHADLGHC